MKQIHKSPFFYYVAVPLVAALWPLLIWGIYLPSAQNGLRNDREQYEQAWEHITELLDIDYERLDFADAEGASAQFNYATAVQKTADLCQIRPTDYKLSSGMIMTSGGQKSQSANVSLDKVNIARFARFLSTIQLRWANLQCTKVTLKKRQPGPDNWDIDVTLKYYF